MGAVYTGASVVVGRAGASTLAELCAVGRGSVLIPFPFATDNHQETNARELESLGAARVVLQKELSADGLSALLGDLLESPGKLEDMAARARAHGRPKAADEIAQACIDMVSER
jgi:UDP-N-acetylglucosamine--N-acetylmuramyl-(pentapeptide) pyrophosphoryl-undecaprenol N-acetylglucosamine transferase